MLKVRFYCITPFNVITVRARSTMEDNVLTCVCLCIPGGYPNPVPIRWRGACPIQPDGWRGKRGYPIQPGGGVVPHLAHWGLDGTPSSPTRWYPHFWTGGTLSSPKGGTPSLSRVYPLQSVGGTQGQSGVPLGTPIGLDGVSPCQDWME